METKKYILKLTTLLLTAGLCGLTAACSDGGDEGKTDESNIEMVMVWINAGIFMMGSPAGETYPPLVNETQHQVTLTEGFYIGKYEITQAQYGSVMGSNPSYFSENNLPVEMVSWYEAVEYCNRLSLKEGLTPAYAISGTNVAPNYNADGYRLPTEAEWEYACRAGTTTAYNTGSNTISDNTGWYLSNSYLKHMR